MDNIAGGLERALTGMAHLKSLLVGNTDPAEEFDPAAPDNKYEIGGLEKLTPRGVEICYRLFDQGKTKYAVHQLMGISFGGATHRYKAWQAAGGMNRTKQPLA